MYHYSSDAFAIRRDYFGEGNATTIWSIQSECNVSETSISECELLAVRNNTSCYSRDAGVTCEGEQGKIFIFL